MTENELSGIIVNAAIEVHRTLGGPGLLESIYEEALVYELEQRGLGVERQKVVPLIYKGKRLAAELRVDLLIEGLVIIECKAAREDNPVFEAQTLTYLRLLDLKLGFGHQLRKTACQRRYPSCENGL